MTVTLERRLYKIIAVEGKNLTGVDPNRPLALPVRVDAPINIWEVKPQPEPGYYRLTLVDAPPFTGVEGDTVVVTPIEELDVNWLIKYHDEHGGFSIALKPLWPTPAWTVSDNREVKIRLYELFPGRNQLFTFEPLD